MRDGGLAFFYAGGWLIHAGLIGAEAMSKGGGRHAST